MIDPRESYSDWLAYARACTNAQLAEVYRKERERSERSPDLEIVRDSCAALAACRTVAAERGIEINELD